MVTKNSPNGVSVHVGAHALRTTSAIFFFSFFFFFFWGGGGGGVISMHFRVFS